MAKELDEKTRAALQKLGHTEDEIAELAEKQKALPAEENVVEKEDTATAVTRETLLAQLGKVLGLGVKEAAPDASEPEEARKNEEVAPVEEVVEAEKAEGGEPDVGALLQQMGEAMAKSIGEQVKAQLDARDKRIADLEETVKAMSLSVEEKVAERLADVPPGARVAPTLAASTIVQETGTGFAFGRPAPVTENYLPELMKSIQQATKDTVGDGKIQV